MIRSAAVLMALILSVCVLVAGCEDAGSGPGDDELFLWLMTAVGENELYQGAGGRVVSDPAAFDTDLGEGGRPFPRGSLVTLTATSREAFTVLPGDTTRVWAAFLGWSAEDCAGADPICVVAMDEPQLVMATFGFPDYATPGPYDLEVGMMTTADLPAGSMLGQISVLAGGSLSTCPPADCRFQGIDSATVVTLTALPAPGSTFRRWLVLGCGADPVCRLTMSRDVWAIAWFEPQ